MLIHEQGLMFNLTMQKRILLFWNTIRFLKPIQIYWRIWLRVKKSKLDLSPPPRLRIQEHSLKPVLSVPSSLELPNKFTFLNETHVLDRPEDWNNQEWEKLWLYNLHYFDDLNAHDASEKVNEHKALIGRWIAENPITDGNGWEPYPTSLRIVNWIKWANVGNPLREEGETSLAYQIRHLKNHLEYHLLGNHLFANGKALIFAGLFFSGAEAENWLKRGLSIVDSELSEQVLDDGGHFELSPMYHSIILEDVLDLFNMANSYPNLIGNESLTLWEKSISKMLNWLNVMSHPDGEISLFNDAATNIAAKPSMLIDYARRLNISPVHREEKVCLLENSGYVRLENDNAVIIADVAKIGPDYLVGHAHADTLTFELSLFDKRVIVNSGTSCYGESNERLYQRSTKAHNTVEINNTNSSEIWRGFRVARRAYPRGVSLSSDNINDTVILSAHHDGYERIFKNKITHYRIWKLRKNELIIQDIISGCFDSAIGRLHLAPEVSYKEKENSVLCKISHFTFTIIFNTEYQVVNSSYHPEFGRVLRNKCIEYTIPSTSKAELKIKWGLIKEH